MMPKLVDDALRLLEQVFVNLLPAAQSNAVIRPRGTFGLQIDAQHVGSSKGGLRRAVAVETNVV